MTTIYKMTFPGSATTIFLFYYCDRASQEIWHTPDAQTIKTTCEHALNAGLKIKQSEILFANVTRWKHGGTIISPESYGSGIAADTLEPLPGIFLAGDYPVTDISRMAWKQQYVPALKAQSASGSISGQKFTHRKRRSMRQVSEFHGIQAVHQMQGQNAAGVERSFAKLLMLGQEACRRPMPMICIPPRPETPFPYGDLVPLGFLLRALQQATECSNTGGLVNRAA